MSFPYVADAEAWASRQARMRRVLDEMLSGKPFDAHAISDRIRAIVAEVPPLPFVVGRRYRIVTMGGEPDRRPRHFESDRGEHLVMEVPIPTEIAPAELEVMFAGRATSGSLLFALPDGRYAMLGDMDVLRADEIEP